MKRNRSLKRKKVLFILMALFMVFFITSCNKGASVSQDPSIDTVSIGEQDETPLLKSDEPIIVEDVEKLIKIRIEDGNPYISFNRQAWIDIHDVEKLGEEYIGEYMKVDDRELSIKTLSGKVLDAAILRLDALDSFKILGFTDLTVFLLMENGTVEWFVAPPRMLTEESSGCDEYGESLKVPWLKDIVEIYYDIESEGIGDMTVFAKDKDGLNYDLRIPCSFYWNLYYSWECVLVSLDDDYGDFVGIMNFDEEGNFSFKTGYRESDADESYSGTYEISLDDEFSKGYRKRMIKIDLLLDYSNWEGNMSPEKIRGIYFAKSVDDESITLRLEDGDPLVGDIYEYIFTPHEYKGEL